MCNEGDIRNMRCPKGSHGSSVISVLKQKVNILIGFFLHTLKEQDYFSNFTNERLKIDLFMV